MNKTLHRIRSFDVPPRHAVVLLAVAGAILLTALVAYDLRREYATTIEAAGLRTQNLTRVLEEHARQSLQRVEVSLLRAVEEVRIQARRSRPW